MYHLRQSSKPVRRQRVCVTYVERHRHRVHVAVDAFVSDGQLSPRLIHTDDRAHDADGLRVVRRHELRSALVRKADVEEGADRLRGGGEGQAQLSIGVAADWTTAGTDLDLGNTTAILTPTSTAVP